MLLRAANNIRRSCWHNRLSYDVAQSYQYLEAVIHLLFFDNIDVLAQEMDNLELCPVDCATFLWDKLAPLLSTQARTLLQIHCERTQANEALEAAMVQRRESTHAVRYFVGLPFKHRKFDYVACIIRWDATCKADETWIQRMGVDSLDRGRHQPFYKSVVLDQEATQRYVAEDNVEAVPLPENYIEQFFEKHASMAKYFQSVQVEETSGNLKRWRLVLSPESKANYPEDDAIASAWVQEGVLP
ncbi:hypothetical protein AGABI1DRAFT_110698 [Agaricus bisporus var. burnettii JB137-S8]|nr:uncharacterized protein AGABI1DRAFT_110698 [Agaricus bisporus var. burnettii JB137-S8]EKM84117.1 hypothetical protein AGABI1DRAFT_110698 [Agaricus bisporus var. burnettii JB137-S8]